MGKYLLFYSYICLGTALKKLSAKNILFMFFRHHVVFGQVISGQEVVREIENQKTDASSKPYAEVRILSCGELIPKSKGKVELYI